MYIIQIFGIILAIFMLNLRKSSLSQCNFCEIILQKFDTTYKRYKNLMPEINNIDQFEDLFNRKMRGMVKDDKSKTRELENTMN